MRVCVRSPAFPVSDWRDDTSDGYSRGWTRSTGGMDAMKGCDYSRAKIIGFLMTARKDRDNHGNLSAHAVHQLREREKESSFVMLQRIHQEV